MAIRLPTRVLERIVRGVSCHRRIEILDLLDTSPESIALMDIAKLCRSSSRAINEHIRRLHLAGFVTKQNRGNRVMHDVTPLGRKFIAFLRSIEPRTSSGRFH